MTEIQLPWAPGAINIHLVCRLGRVRGDGDDLDEYADLFTQGGSVTLSCSVAGGKARYSEADGRRRMLSFEVANYRIRASDGELYNEKSGQVGVSVVSGATPGMDPAGFTWLATVTPDHGPGFTAIIPALTEPATVDLVDATDDLGAASPGTTALAGRVTAVEDRVTVLEGSSSGGTITSVAWTEVTGKPSEFPALPHRHDASEITDDIISEPEILFAITDEDGRRTDLELGQDGTLTDRVVTGLTSRVIIQGQTAIEAAMSAPNLSGDATGVIYAVVDEDERVTDIELGRDGRFTDRAMVSISSRVTPTASFYRAPYETVTTPLVSGPDIVLWGDSLTGAGGWDSLLSAATGRTVRRCGVGGETSAGIAARQGGMPYLMVAAGGSIPASGPVDVTLTSSGGGVSWPLLQGAGTANGYADGVLCGVSGRLTLVKGATPLPNHGNDDLYVFTRSSAGAVVACDRPSPFYWDNGAARASDIAVFWAGSNNRSDPDRVLADVRAMAGVLRALDKRFLVVGPLNSATDTLTSQNANYLGVKSAEAQMLAEYGRRFLNLRRYLIDYGLADRGITPTSQDNADIADDVIPLSLRSDSIHQNNDGKAVTAAQVELRLRELGWV